MSRSVLSVFAAFFLLFGTAHAQQMAKLTAKTLLFGQDRYCSGTAIGPHALLTAEHCLKGEPKTVEIDGQAAQIVSVTKGGRDHVIIRVSLTFRHFAQFGNKPFQGQRVHIIGNPGMEKLYRTGYIAGISSEGVVLDMNVFFGDSGAGLFDESGKLVGVVSGFLSNDVFRLALAFPLAFTPEQIAAAAK